MNASGSNIAREENDFSPLYIGLILVALSLIAVASFYLIILSGFFLDFFSKNPNMLDHGSISRHITDFCKLHPEPSWIVPWFFWAVQGSNYLVHYVFSIGNRGFFLVVVAMYEGMFFLGFSTIILSTAIVFATSFMASIIETFLRPFVKNQ